MSPPSATSTPTGSSAAICGGDQVSGEGLAGGAEVELDAERNGQLPPVEAHLTPARRRPHPHRAPGADDRPAAAPSRGRSRGGRGRVPTVGLTSPSVACGRVERRAHQVGQLLADLNRPAGRKRHQLGVGPKAAARRVDQRPAAGWRSRARLPGAAASVRTMRAVVLHTGHCAVAGVSGSVSSSGIAVTTRRTWRPPSCRCWTRSACCWCSSCCVRRAARARGAGGAGGHVWTPARRCRRGRRGWRPRRCPTPVAASSPMVAIATRRLPSSLCAHWTAALEPERPMDRAVRSPSSFLGVRRGYIALTRRSPASLMPTVTHR